jgi:hypothetical protein
MSRLSVHHFGGRPVRGVLLVVSGLILVWLMGSVICFFVGPKESTQPGGSESVEVYVILDVHVDERGALLDPPHLVATSDSAFASAMVDSLWLTGRGKARLNPERIWSEEGPFWGRVGLRRKDNGKIGFHPLGVWIDRPVPGSDPVSGSP